MSYLMIKHTHSALAGLSGLLFLSRFILFRLKPNLAQNKLLKIAPHIIDTGLLAAAIALCIQLSQYPLSHHWLTAKVIALLAYIAFGTVAIKRNHLPAFIAALTCYGYIIGAALNHSPWSWLQSSVGG